ncbi:hypothetical protein FN3523_1618 [Francisella hispaniensis]|uniref:Uncharacterized protein n=1 Tax=Francisella hispaniensis TaxID=622488 RepID=F4BHH7_9GAMM|nr:hypothetical protein FN3523_1618 [Francisella hispaniensis]
MILFTDEVDIAAIVAATPKSWTDVSHIDTKNVIVNKVCT